MTRKLLLLILISLMTAISAIAQSIVAKGTVYDEFNEPLPGVNIRLKKNPSKGTSSNIDGQFSLEVKKGDILIFTFVGFKPLEMPANTSMKVQMKPDSELLDDVVVVGYMQRKITNTSASVVKLGSKDLANKPTANPLDAMQGKVAGLQVFSNSGEPSSQLSVLLHGNGSFAAGGGPLYIMDGAPVSLAVIRAMNANDFESVQFLKDASATSVYGARAANGVIYITTKRGRADKTADISVRSSYGISTLANPSYFDQLMTASELKKYYKETGLTQQKGFDQPIGDADYKWYRYIYRPAPLYKADMSISGNSGNTSYYLSLGGLSQKGLRQASYYDKIFARLNLNTELNEYVRMGLNTFVSNDWSRSSPHTSLSVLGGLGALNTPLISPYDKDGKELDYIEKLQIDTPKTSANARPKEDQTFIISSNGNVTITPIRNLVFRSLVSAEVDYSTSFSRVKPSYRKALGIGSSSRSYGRAINLSTTNTITYTFDSLGDHGLTLLGGHEYVSFHHDGFGAGGSGISHDELLSLNQVTKDKYVGENLTEHAFLSFFTQIAYSYEDRYFLDLVFRNDASSRFGSAKRNGQFWSVGLLWKMKKESFLKHVSWIDDLDFKVSYGTQGNSSIPPYSTSGYSGKSGQYQKHLGLGLISYGNPNLSWEKQSKFTIGINTQLFRFLGLNIEYYNRLTTDMITELPLDYTSGLGLGNLGYSVYLANAGKYLNHGLDVKVSADLLQGKDYAVSSYFNFNYNMDKIVALFDDRKVWLEPESSIAYIVGKPLTFTSAIYKGINSDTGKPEWYLPGKDRSVKVMDDSKVVSEYDSEQLEQNTGIPVHTPMTGGFGFEGQWRDFFFGMDFSFALGKHMIAEDRRYFENDYQIRHIDETLGYPIFNGSRRLFDYWKQPGDKTEFPSLEYVRAQNTDHQSVYFDDHLIENASFMRMKNLTIGYRLPQGLISKQKLVKGGRIFFSGRNLLTFTKYRGIDPEVNSTASVGANPNTKQLSVNVELSF